jgi:hypothetical protein
VGPVHDADFLRSVEKCRESTVATRFVCVRHANGFEPVSLDQLWRDEDRRLFSAGDALSV